MSFEQLIKNRRSTRKFISKSIEKEKIELLKKAAILSPTGKQKNHWDFIFIEDPEMLKSLSLSKPHGSKLIEGCALAVAVLGDSTESDTWIEDCSIASIMMQMQAEELELGSCWVQIHKREHNAEMGAEEYVKNLLGIPNSKSVLSIIAFGYPEKRRAPIDDSELLHSKIHFEIF